MVAMTFHVDNDPHLENRLSTFSSIWPSPWSGKEILTSSLAMYNQAL